MYDIFFKSGKGTAKGLIEACSDRIASGARILDVGAGTGNVACEAARRFEASIVVGIDIEEEALELARHKAVKYSLGNVAFQWGDALDLPFGDNTFDAVLANQVVTEPTQQLKFLTEMVRVVRPEGAVGVAKANPVHNQIMQWVDDVALEIASRRGLRPPRTEENPWDNALPLSQMLERLGVQEVKTKRIVSAHTDFSTFMINVMIKGRDLLELVDYVAQCDQGDKEAQARGCWEFLQVGRALLDEKYGGSLEVMSEIVSGAKARR